MTDTKTQTTGQEPQAVSKATEKQLRFINTLLGQLRPYYTYEQWLEIEEQVHNTLATATIRDASKLIRTMLRKVSEQHALHPREHKSATDSKDERPF